MTVIGDRTDSIGTCALCGYYGPGPRHDCVAVDKGDARETRPAKPCSLWSWCTLSVGHTGQCWNVAPKRHPVRDAALVSLYDHNQLPRAKHFPHADHAGRPLRGKR